MFKQITLFLVFATLLALGNTAAAQKQAKDIYAFGYATCLGDSVAYVSAIQVLPDGQMKGKTDILENWNVYASQMEHAMKAQYGKPFTCSVFYSENKTELEKRFLKIRRRIADEKSLRLEELPATAFKFQAIR